METETLFQFGSATRAAELVAALTAAGHSNTRARRAVLESLCHAEGPLSPGDLLAAGRGYHTALGLVTVYRTLEILQSLSLVRKLHLEDGCHRYVLSPAALEGAAQAQRRPDGHSGARSHGHHIVCDRCGRAVEFEGCDIDPVIASVEIRTGFRVRDHWLEMFGLCPDCKAAEGAA